MNVDLSAPNKVRRKSAIHVFLLIVLASVALFAVAEMYQRVQQWRHGRTPIFSNEQPGPFRHDKQLGWAGRESYKSTSTRRTFGGATYRVQYSVDATGLRHCSGDQGRKILVMGDSHTGALEVSDDKPYPCVVARDLHASAVSYGAGGYGSLQERMLLERYIPQVQPDLIIVQLGYDDYINNDFDLEKGSFANNHSMMRPYWRSGRVQYLWPSHFPMWFEFARSQSRVFANLYNNLLQQKSRTERPVEDDIEKMGAGYPGFDAAVTATREVYAQIKAVSAGRSLVVAAADLREPYITASRKMAQDLGLLLIEDGAAAFNAAEARGVDVYYLDKIHFSEAGHQIFGDALAKAILAHPELHFQ